MTDFKQTELDRFKEYVNSLKSAKQACPEGMEILFKIFLYECPYTFFQTELAKRMNRSKEHVRSCLRIMAAGEFIKFTSTQKSGTFIELLNNKQK